MESLVGYGSDDDYDAQRYESRRSGFRGGPRRKDDDTNYDDVNMDMSEDSQQEESEPELPQAEPSRHSDQDDRRSRGSSRHDSQSDSSERRRDSPAHRNHRDRSPRRDDRRSRNERSRFDTPPAARKGLLGDRPDDHKHTDSHKVPSLMDINPFGGGEPPRSQDSRDAANPRFVDRNRRDRERERDRDRHGRRSQEGRRSERRSRSRDRGTDRGDKFKSRPAYPPAETSTDRRASPPGSYHSTSYKVNKKLDVMEKMGLQIKTPDGMMTTAQQLRQAATETGGAPPYFSGNTMNTNRIRDQVEKRKLLWSNKNKPTPAEAGTWSGTRFAQDSDGKQATKFMRLMGIKETDGSGSEKPVVDPVRKQEEMFQAMQQQYEVARATTHTMRGVGLGFQRGQY